MNTYSQQQRRHILVRCDFIDANMVQLVKQSSEKNLVFDGMTLNKMPLPVFIQQDW